MFYKNSPASMYAGNKFFSYKYNETFPVPRNFDKK